MAIQLTEAAARHVAGQLAKRGTGEGLRIRTKKSGCTGFAYVVDFADSIDAGDHVFESHGVKLVVDDKSLPNLDGMVVDFVRTNLLNEGFEIGRASCRERV